MIPKTGAERVAHHGNTLPCEDPNNFACDPVYDEEVASGRIRTLTDLTSTDAYKAGRWDFINGSVDQARFQTDEQYSSGYIDASDEAKLEEDRCSNGCVCTALDKVVADNPEVSLNLEDEQPVEAMVKRRVYVAFDVAEDTYVDATDSENLAAYLGEMLELPQTPDSSPNEGYWITGVHVYGSEAR